MARADVVVALRFQQNSLCLFVPWWFTIFHHGGTKAQRDTEVFADDGCVGVRFFLAGSRF